MTVNPKISRPENCKFLSLDARESRTPAVCALTNLESLKHPWKSSDNPWESIENLWKAYANPSNPVNHHSHCVVAGVVVVVVVVVVGGGAGGGGVGRG